MARHAEHGKRRMHPRRSPGRRGIADLVPMRLEMRSKVGVGRMQSKPPSKCASATGPRADGRQDDSHEVLVRIPAPGAAARALACSTPTPHMTAFRGRCRPGLRLIRQPYSLELWIMLDSDALCNRHRAGHAHVTRRGKTRVSQLDKTQLQDPLRTIRALAALVRTLIHPHGIKTMSARVLRVLLYLGTSYRPKQRRIQCCGPAAAQCPALRVQRSSFRMSPAADGLIT